MQDRQITISVIGLGYVGLPVAVEFARKYPVIGFDISERRVSELSEGFDRNHEISADDLRLPGLTLSSDNELLRAANFHIVAVPTPIDGARQPDLTPIVSASRLVGSILKKGDIVVYESTVFPGLTEEICLPLLEKESGLKGGTDFKIGYSPERINPGDKEHGFTTIRKIVSGQDEEALGWVARVYGSVVTAGVFRAESIKVAEAAKVIENTQRDLNIALMNELAIIFDQMQIDTRAVLEAAGTKWNFLKFVPGLVGGHCIGVDPYYLTHRAEAFNYHPQVILAGRRMNDGMGRFLAQKTIKELIQRGTPVKGSVVTVLGFTFKENCRDLRNTRVIDIVRELEDFGVRVQVCDPYAYPDEARHEYAIELKPVEDVPPADALVLAVAHDKFRDLASGDYRRLVRDSGVIIDVKGICPRTDLATAGYRVWRL